MQQHDISDVMLGHVANPMIGGRSTRKDAVEVKEVPKFPPLLSKVMEACPITSQSLFLALPPEILAAIMALIANDAAALSALARVNSDCRRLARFYQFVDVCFDYGPQSKKLIERLLAEAQARADGASDTTTSLFIGSCIRQVKVHPAPQHVAAAHKDLWEAKWGRPKCGPSQQQLDDLRNNAAHEYLFNYRRPSLKVLAQAMPHLVSLLWNDRMCLDVEVFETLARLPLQHLKFSEACIGVPLSLESVVPHTIPLKSISLGVGLCKDAMQARGVTTSGNPGETTRLSSFIQCFLKRCCGSLESLTVKTFGSNAEQFRGHDTMVFPRLRYLDLTSGTSYPDAAAWLSFLAAPLRHLSLPLNGINTSREYMSGCPTLQDLETLVVPSLSMETDLAKLVVGFVLQHSHVRKLSVQNGKPKLLDQHILPALASEKWSNLTSLSISWRNPEVMTPYSNEAHASISAESLAAITRIKSLEQLCLNAGETSRWRHHWLPDHNDLRLRLQGLENLQKLAFSKDSYELPDKIPIGDMEAYYTIQWVTQVECNDSMARLHLDPVECGRLKFNKLYGAHQLEIFSDCSFEDGDDDACHADIMNPIPSTRVWERAHRNRMLSEAEQYATVFPKLNWVFCGQLPMSVKATEGSEGTIFEATALSQQRDTLGKILTSVFEMKGDD